MKSFNLDDALKQHLSGNFQQAEKMYTAVLENYPEHFAPHFYMASLKAEQNKLYESAVYLHRALEIEKHPAAYNNLGTIYRRLNNQELAIKWLKAGLENPGEIAADILNNLGTAYINEGEPSTGEPYLRDALERDPGHVQAHWNLGLLLLERGVWAEGWDNFHWGVVSPERMNRWATWPQWRRETYGTVLIYGEQGIGDEIMFTSMIEDAKEDANHIILECHPRLIDTIKRTYEDDKLTAVPTRKAHILEEPHPEFQHKTAIGDLGMLYRRGAGDFPKRPYLKLDPKLIEKVYDGYLRYPKPWVGIGWKGGAKKTRRDLRSLHLDKWMPILKDFKGTFFSFQYDKDADLEVQQFCEEHPEINLVHFPAIARADNYDVILTHLWCMDCVVHVNGSAVHACGAIGTPCFTLTPSKPAWRYGVEGEEMPWYGHNVKQIRQKGDDWQSVIDRAAQLVHSHAWPRRMFPSNAGY
jgi:hypothetical protein